MARPTKRAQINKKIGEGVTKLKPPVVKRLEEAFAMDCSIPEACAHANISKQTYYNWIKENPELLDRFDQLRQKPYLKARMTILKSLKSAKHAEWYLERKKKEEFSTRHDITSGGEPITGINYVLPNGNNNPARAETTPSIRSPKKSRH